MYINVLQICYEHGLWNHGIQISVMRQSKIIFIFKEYTSSYPLHNIFADFRIFSVKNPEFFKK